MRYVRNTAVEISEIGDELFLIEPAGEKMYYLDEVSSGVWRLIEPSCERTELFEIYAAAFPDIKTEQLTQDLTKVIDDMCAAGLIREAVTP